MKTNLTRRGFMKLTGVIGLSMATAGTPAMASSSKTDDAQQKGVLMDITKCIGCKQCTPACQKQNNLPEDRDAADLSPKAWTYIDQVKVKKDGNEVVRNVKHQCFNCLRPACASACPVRAFVKTEKGPVKYEAWRCMGCRYCMVACSFNIPRYQWDRLNPFVTKCIFCHELVSEGEKPACVSACPVGAITFGKRDELLNKAREVIAAEPDKYVQHIYGESEIGGTGFLYISDVPFEDLGFNMSLGTTPPPYYTEKALAKIPGVVGGLGAFLTAAYLFNRDSDKDQVSDKQKEVEKDV